MAWFRMKPVAHHTPGFCIFCNVLFQGKPDQIRWVAHTSIEVTDDEATILLLSGYRSSDQR